MSTELEQRLADLKQGDHVCLIYESDAERLAAIAAYLVIGLAAAERCAYICEEGGDADIAAALVGVGIDVQGEIARGALLLLSPRETYLRAGAFDPPAMLSFLADASEAALAADFSGFRVTADMAWALGPEPGCERLIEFEALANRYFPSSRALAVCQYDRRRFPADVIRDVLRTHPLAILDGQVCSNLYYEAPELLLGHRPVDEHLTWMISQLKRWRLAELERAELAREQVARATAERALELRGELIVEITHDLRNPLTAIKGYAQLMRHQLRGIGDAGPQRLLRSIETIEGTAARMARMIDQLLETSYAELGPALPLDPRPTDLVALAQRMVAEYPRPTSRHHLAFEAEVPELIGWWDSTYLERVIDNLLGNAVKYSPDGGEIRMTIESVPGSDGDAVLTVADQGVGIPAVDLPRIFDRCRRGGNAAAHADGLGVGLTAARRIVEQHGGTIGATSQEGRGATFTVRLPVNVSVAVDAEPVLSGAGTPPGVLSRDKEPDPRGQN